MNPSSERKTDGLLEAARICASGTEDSVDALLDLLKSSSTAQSAALYMLHPAGETELLAGEQNGELLEAICCDEALRAKRYPCVAVISIPTPPVNGLTQQSDPRAIVAVRLNDAVKPKKRRLLIENWQPFFSIAIRREMHMMEAMRAREAAERQLDEITKVQKICQAIDRVQEDEFLDVITAKAVDVLDGDAGLLYLQQQYAERFLASSAGSPEAISEFTQSMKDTGLVERVAGTPEPLLITTLPSEGGGQASALLLPIYDENGSLQGILCLRRSLHSTPFGDHDLKLLDLFTAQATLGINNRSLYTRMNRQLQELSTLSSLTESLISTRDIDTLLNEVADSIAEVVNFDRCRIYIADPDTGRLSIKVTRGFEMDPATDVSINIGIGEGVIGQVAHSREPILVQSLHSASPTVKRFAKALGVQSFYAQPIVARGRCIGVVVVSDHVFTRSISDSRIVRLSTFVHHAAIAIENAQIYKTQERRYAELTTLYEISRRLASSSGVRRAAQTVTELATTVTRSDSALLLLFNARRDSLRPLHSMGFRSDTIKLLADLPGNVHPIRKPRRLPTVLNHDIARDIFALEWQPVCHDLLTSHRSVALVPLVVEDLPIGYLILGKLEGDFDPEQLKLIAVASSQAAAALQSAWNYERRIGLHELELTALYELMQKVRSAKTQDEAHNAILELVAVLVPCDNSALLTIDSPPDTVTLRAARGPRASHLVGATGIPLEGIVARAIRERTGLISSDPLSDAEAILRGSRLPAVNDSKLSEPSAAVPEPSVSSKEAVRSLVAVPLAAGTNIIGVLLLESDVPDLFTEESVRVLHLVASQAATIYQEISSLRALTQYTDNVLRSIAAGVVTADKDSNIVTWNPRAEEILGLPPEQISGKPYAEVFGKVKMDPQVRDDTIRMLDMTAHTGKVFNQNNLRYRTRKDDDAYMNLTATKLKGESGEYLGIVVVFEEVTRAAQMKEEVDRISRLAETGQLAANIAHELRNPLSSIKGAAQLLRNELPPEVAQQHGEFLEIIVDEVNGLNRITTEFLEFSRVMPPDMRLHNFNLMIARIIKFMQAYLMEQSIMVCLDFDEQMPPVYLDKTQIEQVVKNVIINGVQAMPQGGALTITTRYHRGQDLAEVSFKDTGIGIAPDKTDKIWMPFFTTKTKGTGLGLPIARKIVETHGGTLTAQSRPGEGSVFTLMAPVHPIFASAQPHLAAELSDQRSHGRVGDFDHDGPNREQSGNAPDQFEAAPSAI